MESSLYLVGVLLKPHGLKGEVKVYPRTDFPEKRFAKGSKLLLQSPEGGPTRTLDVGSGRQQQNLFIVKFQQFSTIEEVERLRGWELKVHKDDLVSLPEGTYYFHDLIGCKVITDEGETLGELSEVLQPGANDVYVVKTPDKRELLLPAIPDCILHVDIDKKTVLVHIMAGLLE